MLGNTLSLVAACLICFSAPMAIGRETHTIAVIGTGEMGSALGRGLARAGHSVIYGSRDPTRDKVRTLVAATGRRASATTQQDAAQKSKIVILAVPRATVESLIPQLGDLSEKIVIDITTAERQGADGYPELSVESSTSELIQTWAPRARIVKTPFSGVSTLRNPLRYREATVTYIAADDREAKELVARLATDLELFPLDAGPLRMAKSIDHLGLLFLVPMMQGRAHTWTMLPRVDADLSCIDGRESWFAPVKDKGKLARIPNLDATRARCGPGAAETIP